ncbi:MAG: flagellar motor protein MotB [Desulfobulbaceae bacterium]|nr:flagellar motor protein MotB [Desulfobulbaceae bacterium]
MSKRKKAHEKEPNLERWLVSYADFITLLFAVFVVLYAMGQVDKMKAEQVMQSVRLAFGVTPPMAKSGPKSIKNSDLRRLTIIGPHGAAKESGAGGGKLQVNDLLLLRDVLDEDLKKEGLGANTRLEINPRGLLVSMQAANLFTPGTATIQKEAYPLLDMIAQTLSDNIRPIAINGYTDDSPVDTGSYKSNWELSSARALAVLHYLVDRHSFDPSLLSATGHAANDPVADNTTEEGRKVNRRVELLVQSDTAEWP